MNIKATLKISAATIFWGVVLAIIIWSLFGPIEIAAIVIAKILLAIGAMATVVGLTLLILSLAMEFWVGCKSWREIREAIYFKRKYKHLHNDEQKAEEIESDDETY